MGLRRWGSSGTKMAALQSTEMRPGKKSCKTTWYLIAPRVLLVTFLLTLLSFAVCVPIFVVLFVVSFIFPPAAVVTVPMKFVLCSWLMAWNFLDYPLCLRHASLSASLNWTTRHLGAVTAFGMAWTLLAIVPPMVLLFLPMGVAGATQLVIESERSPDEHS